MKRIERLMEEALELPVNERTRMALRLLDSVEAPDPHAHLSDDELEKEIERRVREIEAGTVKPIPWEEVRETLRRELRG